MARGYRTPAALERALTERIVQRFPRNEIQFRRNEIAYRRLVARMYAADPDRWVIKGGFAMILRLDPNRTSNDIDVVYLARAGEHAVALEALERAVGVDLDDFFSFEILRVGEETEDRARRVSLLCRLGVREFVRFRVDLALPQPHVPVERIEAPPLTGVDAVDELPPLLALAWPQQIADKVCAIFERHGDGYSSRARDLADLGMIAQQIDGLDGDELVDALRTEEALRRERSLPDGLPASFALAELQERDWRGNFGRASRGAPISFDEAFASSSALIDPLLRESARGHRWSVVDRAFI
jgi:nucleotidyltransferase AbiEii toxin of type IV toxin-antitoxin system